VLITYPDLHESAEDQSNGLVSFAGILMRNGRVLSIESVCDAIDLASRAVSDRYDIELE